MPKSVTERVAAGAALLDGIPRWEKHINIRILDMRYGRGHKTCCVLAQLGRRGFWRQLFALGVANYCGPEAVELGFDAINGAEYPALTREWRRVLLKRLADRRAARASA